VVFSPVYDEPDHIDLAPSERRTRCAGLMIVVYRVDDIMASLRAQNPDVEGSAPPAHLPPPSRDGFGPSPP
jgi:hypothetical protein